MRLNKFIIGILRLSLTFLAFFLYSNSILSQNEQPIAKNGQLDLQEWNFEKDGIVRLDGEWEFYWNKLYFPNHFNNNDLIKERGFIKVPSNWKGHKINQKEIANKGVATYRLTIQIDSTNKKLKFHYPVLTTAMVIYVNGKQVAKNGNVSYDQTESIPDFKFNSFEFINNSKTIEVVIHIANFHQVKGGIFASLAIGEDEQVDILLRKQNMSTSFLIGCFLLIVIFHIILYALRPKEKSSLYFALSSFGFFIYFFIVHGAFSFYFPDTKFLVLFRLVLISLTIIVGFFFLFVYSLFRRDYSRTAIRLIIIANALIILMSFLPSSFLYKPFLSIYSQALLFLASLYTIYVIIKAFLKKRQDAGVFLIGFGVFILSMINDTLNSMNIISSVYIIEFGLLTFFLFQSYIISARFSRAFKLSENLRVELKDINENLEDLVVKRTYKIQQQKEEILSQSEQLISQNEKLIELDRFKQGMTSMIVHDLKNPLNTILRANDTELKKARQGKKGIIRSTGMQMLNMILNILDVSKFEETNITLNIEKNSLASLFSNAAEQVAFLLEQKNIHLTNSTVENYTILCDREVTERIFINLLTNAIKYSEHNSKIEFLAYPANVDQIPEELKSIKLLKKNSNQLIIALKDYGVGMKKEVLSKIFQKFKQIEATDSGTVKSTGLGLTFCKLAVEAHNGQIGVISEPNKGAIFWFSLKQEGKIDNKEPTTNLSFVEDEMITLTEEEKNEIKNYLTDLNQCEFYEVTNIRKILANISSDSSDSINNWKNMVELAVTNCNEGEYEKLIKSV